jgi:AcrR family transcriptional regulator
LKLLDVSLPALQNSGAAPGDGRAAVKPRRTRSSPQMLRDAVLEAAHDLFYLNGYDVTSVDEIAQATGTHKMTVYRLFESKEKLALAYLERVERSAKDRWDTLLRQHHDAPLRVLRAFFAHLAHEVRAASYLGDRSLKLALEVRDASSEILTVCESHRLLQRERFQRIAAQRGIGHPAALADMFYLIWLAAVTPGRGEVERRRDALAMRTLVTDVMLSAASGVSGD